MIGGIVGVIILEMVFCGILAIGIRYGESIAEADI